MREIRARVSTQHGIELSNQQIQELAARRLEAILDPKTVKPSLMDELRRSAGIAPDPLPPEPEPTYSFDEDALYESSGSVVRVIRRLLNPLLNLLINPKALIQALSAQVRLNSAAAAREAEERRRRVEWNGLHFEILRRLVVDIARADLERQNLALQVESLSAKVDFNERRVRAFEQSQLQVRPAPRTPEPLIAATPTPAAPQAVAADQGSTEGADASRRRRRRRRGRRTGAGPLLGDTGGTATTGSATAATGGQPEDESGQDETSPTHTMDASSNTGESVTTPETRSESEPGQPGPAPRPVDLEPAVQAAVPEPAAPAPVEDAQPGKADESDPTIFNR